MKIKWEISFIELRENGKKYKVTRKIPNQNISETKFFNSKIDAIEQHNEWLQDQFII
jgi:hypothetical protein